MTASVRIWWDTSVQAYRIVAPFNRQFIDLLKTLIPVSDRSYDDSSKTWTITERFLKPVQDLVENAFHTKATVVTKEQAQQAQMPPATAKTTVEAAIVEFFKLLPREAAEAAYKKACFVLHPDRGGDMEKMSKFNAAWQRVCKELWPNG